MKGISLIMKPSRILSLLLLFYLFAVLVSCGDVDNLSVDEENLGRLVPPTADQDSALPQLTVKVAGQERVLHLETFGDDGRPVLFVLHGTYTDYRSLRPLKVLADRYFVVLWDQRGCGLSERITAEEFTFDSAVEEIDRLKEHFSPNQPVTLIGHSWGGGLAALYISRRPDNVRQAVLAEPMPLTGEIMNEIKSDIIKFSFANERWNEMCRMNDFLSPKDHESIDYRAMMMLKDNSMVNYFCDPDNPPELPIWRVGGYLEWVRNKRLMDGLSFNYDFTQGLASFDGEVLILGGSCGALGYEMQRVHTASFFRNVEVMKIQQAGHRMFVEQFDRIIEVLRGFLTEYTKQEGEEL